MFNFIELVRMENAVEEYIFCLEKKVHNCDTEEFKKYLMRQNEYKKLKDKLNKIKFEVLEQSEQLARNY